MYRYEIHNSYIYRQNEDLLESLELNGKDCRRVEEQRLSRCPLQRDVCFA